MIYRRKKRATPVRVMAVARTSRREMRWWLMMAYGAMMSIGVRAIRVEAMSAVRAVIVQETATSREIISPRYCNVNQIVKGPADKARPLLS